MIDASLIFFKKYPIQFIYYNEKKKRYGLSKKNTGNLSTRYNPNHHFHSRRALHYILVQNYNSIRHRTQYQNSLNRLLILWNPHSCENWNQSM